MATLRKRGKSYTILVTTTIGHTLLPNGKQRNIQRTIACFKLGRVPKETALIHKNEVKEVEPLIKSGKLNEDNWNTQFSFLNDQGKSNVIAYRNLGETIDEYMRFKKVHVRESSYKRIKISMDRLLEVIPSKTILKKIKTKHITLFIEKFQKKHRLAGMNVNLRNIKTLFRWAYDEEYIDRLPKIVIHKPPEEDRHISEDTYIQVLKACDPFYKSVFRVYLETGKRRSELIDATLRGKFLLVPVKEGLKSKKPHKIKLNDRQVETIRELHKKRDEFLGKGYKLENFKRKFTDMFTNKLKELGLYDKWYTKLHSLRHSSGILIYLETEDIKAVKKKLNHDNLEMSDYYSNIDDDTIETDFPTMYEVLQIAKKEEENGKSVNSKCQFGDLN